MVSVSDLVEVWYNFGIPNLPWKIDQLSIAAKVNLTQDLKPCIMFNTASNLFGYWMMICSGIMMKPFLKNEIIHILSITLFDIDNAVEIKCAISGFKLQICHPYHCTEQNWYLLLQIPNQPHENTVSDQDVPCVLGHVAMFEYTGTRARTKGTKFPNKTKNSDQVYLKPDWRKVPSVYIEIWRMSFL